MGETPVQTKQNKTKTVKARIVKRRKKEEEEQLTSNRVSTENSVSSMGNFELGWPFSISPVEAKVLRLWSLISAHHWPQLVS